MFERFAGRRAGFLQAEGAGRFAVAVPFLPEENALLFEVRADTLKRQPGEVSFPGGAIEPGETPRRAALRETCEELLVKPSSLRVVAPLDVLVHMNTALVYPFLTRLTGYMGSFSQSEVKAVFTVPFGFFLKQAPEVYHNEVAVTRLDSRFPPELAAYPWGVAENEVLFYRYGGQVIWGMTARIVHHLTEVYRTLY